MKNKSPYQHERDKRAYVEDVNERLEWLDDQRYKLLAYCESLKAQAESLRNIENYSNVFRSSSPVTLLVSMIKDLLLTMRRAYQEGRAKTGPLNPSIIFDERLTDPLGNIKSSKQKYWVEEIWSPQLSAFCEQLFIFFSRSMVKDFNFSKDFDRLRKNLSQFLPPEVSQKSIKAEKNNQQRNAPKANARRAYYHRRRR